ncbi:MAG: hypothetical protein M0Q93_11000 [Terrimicrobiaceae bacterium]|nr:hypothetical protein [Terrimicrobiaceae bacterium]
MKALSALLALWAIAQGVCHPQSTPIIGNVPENLEWKDGKLISAKGFPPYTEIKDSYTGRLWIVQTDGSVKAEADLPRIKGTLTLRGGQLVFASESATEEYESGKAPGVKVVSFTPKTAMKDAKEINVAEMTIEIYDGRLKLVEGIAVPVIKVIDGDYVQWKSKKK